MMKKIVLIGAGGHARSVADSIEKAGLYQIQGFVDYDIHAKCKEYKRLGTDEDLSVIRESGVDNAVICLGFLGEDSKRQSLFRVVKQLDFCLPVIIDPSAVVAVDVKIGEGSFVGKMAVINSAVEIGSMSIINSGAIVEHDSTVGDFSHVAINSSLCGGCAIGEATLIGANATVLQGVKVGSHAIVGAGSVVLSNVPDGSKVIGVYHG